MIVLVGSVHLVGLVLVVGLVYLIGWVCRLVVDFLVSPIWPNIRRDHSPLRSGLAAEAVTAAAEAAGEDEDFYQDHDVRKWIK